MNLLIFGNNNRPCFQLVKQALAGGHYVTFFTCTSSTFFSDTHENLYHTTGDTLNYNSVEEAMQGQEVVVNAMFFDLHVHDTLFVSREINIVKAMRVNNVSRYILLSRHGVSNSLMKAPLWYKISFIVSYRKKMRQLLQLMILENLAKESSLRWTIVRSVAITTTGTVKKEPVLVYCCDKQVKKSFISLDALVSFLLSVMNESTFVNRIVTISGR